uniref:NADH-ubiquinone oxidoreductase chain 4L n=2 Tax=Dermestes TaxID=219541 RepID=A0A6C0RW45_9COLE|nr:NADH dehydrogenase subunit 4L [Dermestes tessellatocollis]QEK77723.1 NADH dehydrogenase subunit 4L [Dermestes tessellatocollis]QIA46729.1 NADH dehydrogenase subunit 4L [Dermestes maculatus]
MMTWFFIYIFMFICGLLSFCINRKHLLMMLLSLEFVVLSLFIIMFIFLSFLSFESYFSLIFLSMSVCEGALGLSILVSLIRTHGNDNFQSFSILW